MIEPALRTASPTPFFPGLAGPSQTDHKDPDRVRRATATAINRAIDRETDRNITRYAGMSDERIHQRIRELDQEWDVERVLELNAATLALGGLLLSRGGDQRWLLLPAVVMGFLLQHAVQGWCPPLPILRRLGVRTRGEIDREKFSLLGLLETGAEA
jgi:hypothetical protein